MSAAKFKEWITADGLTKIEGWARDGLTDKQIAEKVGITIRTLHKWKIEHPEIKKALEKGKDIVDRHVENALLQRALGYSYEETKRTKMPDGGEKIERTIKHVSPDVTAQIFWLKNRKPDRWRDKVEYENHDALDKLDEMLAAIRAQAGASA